MVVGASEYTWVQKDVLELKGPLPAEFTLESTVKIKPEVQMSLLLCVFDLSTVT